MTKREKQIAGQIVYITSDIRHRVFIKDEIAWLEKKIAEIKRLAEMLPYSEFNPAEGKI